MSTAEMQAYVARLYVDDSFRKLFELAPELTLAGYKLTVTEQEALRGLDRVRLDFFAASLKSKRKKKMTQAYPALFRLEPGALDRYYDRYVQLYPTRPDETVFDDVVDFGRFIEATLAGDPDVRAFASEVARYERLYYSTRNLAEPAEEDTAAGGEPPSLSAGDPAVPAPARGATWAAFHYDVLAITESLRHDREPGEPRAGEHHIVFQMPPGATVPKVFRVSGGTRMLLDLCDGRRDIAAITAAVERETGNTGLGDEVAGMIRKLLSLRLLRIR